eukprot:14285093-Alexandrium_andersonii.AAC.1
MRRLCEHTVWRRPGSPDGEPHATLPGRFCQRHQAGRVHCKRAPICRVDPAVQWGAGHAGG